MKILFYIEPHPIRNNLHEFQWVAQEIIKMLLEEYTNEYTLSSSEAKLLCSRAIHSDLVKAFNGKDIANHILGLTKEENNHIQENYYNDWNDKDILKWEELLKGDGEISQFYGEIIKRTYNRYMFDVIIYWGTNGAVKNFSKRFNIPSISMELGCTRKPFFESCYLDFNGVNGASYLNKIDINNYEESYSIQEIQTFLPIRQKYEKSFDAMFDVLPHDISNVIYRNIGKNILIPLQLRDDTNIILYSRYNSMLEYLEEILPKLIDKGFYCYIKPHPGNVVREINTIDHKKCEEYCYNLENVYWLNDFNNNKHLLSLYNKMDAFIVINSSVGFEAMLLEKLVIPIGRSPYNITDKLPTFDSFINDTIDKAEYLNTITKIVNLLLFNYLHLKDNAFNFPYFNSLIIFNMNLFFARNDKEKLESLITNTPLNSRLSYLYYPPRKKVIKNKTVETIVTTIEESNLINKIKHKLKKLPIVGKLLISVKNRIKN